MRKSLILCQYKIITLVGVLPAERNAVLIIPRCRADAIAQDNLRQQRALQAAARNIGGLGWLRRNPETQRPPFQHMSFAGPQLWAENRDGPGLPLRFGGIAAPDVIMRDHGVIIHAV